MSRDSFSVNSTPYEEKCAQVGEDNYRRKAMVECVAYINQLHRLFPEAKSHGDETRRLPADGSERKAARRPRAGGVLQHAGLFPRRVRSSGAAEFVAG